LTELLSPTQISSSSVATILFNQILSSKATFSTQCSTIDLTSSGWSRATYIFCQSTREQRETRTISPTKWPASTTNMYVMFPAEAGAAPSPTTRTVASRAVGHGTSGVRINSSWNGDCSSLSWRHGKSAILGYRGKSRRTKEMTLGQAQFASCAPT
jgi:hypothetical protein